MLRVKNWPKFQHFQNRRPPWIKVYRELLDDIEWHRLDPISAKVLVMLWLLASEDGTKTGALPGIGEIAFRLRLSESVVKSAISSLSHWLESDDINLISTRYQHDTPETETETEKETETDRARGDDIKPVSKPFSSETRQLAMSVFGHEPIGMMSQWLESGWTDDVVRKALTAAQASGKKIGPAYVNAILKGWAVNGVPDDAATPNGNGNGRTPGGLDALLALGKAKA